MKESTQSPERPLRVAMWSGPRNISTALMRAWGNRDDSFVCDEPLYAHYLVKTGLPHPMAREVIASQDNDWKKVEKREIEMGLEKGKPREKLVTTKEVLEILDRE